VTRRTLILKYLLIYQIQNKKVTETKIQDAKQRRVRERSQARRKIPTRETRQKRIKRQRQAQDETRQIIITFITLWHLSLLFVQPSVPSLIPPQL